MWKDIAISELVSAQWNYKGEEPALTVKLKKNIKRNGLIQNLIVRELPDGKYECVNGNHRLDVLRSLKHKSAMCFNLGNVSDEYAYKVSIVTNETRFESDKRKLGETLKELKDTFGEDEMVLTMPFSLGDMQAMTTILDDQWEKDPILKGAIEHEPQDDFKEEKPMNLNKIELILPKKISERFLNFVVKLAGEEGEEVGPSDLDNSGLITILNKKIQKALK